MAKKKQKEEKYTEKEIMDAENTIGDIMSQCSNDIWEVISKYPFPPVMWYGILESIKSSIANDVYTTTEKEPHICNDCKDTIEHQVKDTPKKAKEAQTAMYI